MASDYKKLLGSMMRQAEVILDIIRTRSQRGLPIDDAYRLLFQPDLYLRAYAKLYKNEGAMTPGVKTVDGICLRKSIPSFLPGEMNNIDGHLFIIATFRKRMAKTEHYQCQLGQINFYRKLYVRWKPIMNRDLASTRMIIARK